jgi:glycosyltransferase involved in cell wall biosynthesis
MGVHRRADCIIVPSGIVREELVALGIRPDRVVVIPNPVAIPEVVDPIDLNDSGILVVACAGRLFRHKGIQHVIGAIAILKRMGVEAVLRVAGDGPRRAELQELAVDLGVSDRVFFHGWVEDMSDFFRESHVVVHVAESESFGLVVAEAMAHARPVLVSPALLKSLPFLRAGVNALVTTGTAEAIAQCLYEAVQRPGYLRGLAERGLRDITRACSPRVVAQAYLEAAKVPK